MIAEDLVELKDSPKQKKQAPVNTISISEQLKNDENEKEPEHQNNGQSYVSHQVISSSSSNFPEYQQEGIKKFESDGPQVPKPANTNTFTTTVTSSSTTNTSPEPTSSVSLNIVTNEFENERLWTLFQEARQIIGSETALEVLGYLKLEIMIKNQARPVAERISPPSFILKALLKPEFKQIINKVCQIFEVNAISIQETPHPLALRRAFMELEKTRPGVIFDLLGNELTDSNWLFPHKLQTAIFGSVLGIDGFSSAKVIYQKQIMIVPIDREGTINEAISRGFRKLVSSSYKFNLVHVGDFEFLVAPVPGETSEQIFVKTITGKTIALTVPVSKARLAFVKCLMSQHEGVSPRQMKFTNSSGVTLDDDEIQLTQLNIKDFSVIHLALRATGQ